MFSVVLSINAISTDRLPPEPKRVWLAPAHVRESLKEKISGVSKGLQRQTRRFAVLGNRKRQKLK